MPCRPIARVVDRQTSRLILDYQPPAPDPSSQLCQRHVPMWSGAPCCRQALGGVRGWPPSEALLQQPELRGICHARNGEKSCGSLSKILTVAWSELADLWYLCGANYDPHFCAMCCLYILLCFPFCCFSELNFLAVSVCASPSSLPPLFLARLLSSLENWSDS